jgi:hypothetical protein
MRMSPEYWGCPECGNGEAWILCNGGLMCADDDCGARFASIGEWIAGRDAAGDAVNIEVTLP